MRAHRTLLALVAVAASARAQTRLGTVAVEAERAPDEADPDRPEADAPPFVTVVEAGRPSARVASVADLLEREAGVQVRQAGGLGAFTAVSIRGSDPGEVAVFLDGVPLHRALSSTVDLSLLPVDGLERVEIWRGVPPVEMGSQAVGGVIRLVSRRGSRKPSLRGSVGGGSFGARSVVVGASSGGRVRLDATAAYRGATGDFIYYDTGTLLSTADDAPLRRANNGFDQLALDATVAAGERTRWTLGSHGFLKVQGVPGRAVEGSIAATTRLTSGRLLLTGSVERASLFGPGADGRLDGYFFYERFLYANPGGEGAGPFGASRTDAQTLGAGLAGKVLAAAGAHELVTLVGSLDVEHHRPHDLLHPGSAPPPSTRLRAAMAISDDLRLAGERLALTPGLRVDGVMSDLAPGLRVAGSGASRAEVFPSPRLGARLRAASWLVVKGGVGRFVRLPSTLELFGDGAFVLPSPTLRAETATSGDLGLRVDLDGARAALHVEAALFGRVVSDYIHLRLSAPGITAVNLDEERRYAGVEARATARVAFAQVALDYTFTSGATDGSDRQLPFVPRHRFGVRAEVRGGPFTVAYDVVWTGDTWVDAANTNLVPARALHGLAATVGPLGRARVTFAVEVRNLADLRVVDQPLGGLIHEGETVPSPLADFYRYPLPGRAVYATLGMQL